MVVGITHGKNSKSVAAPNGGAGAEEKKVGEGEKQDISR
jgi:hypothetical protein